MPNFIVSKQKFFLFTMGAFLGIAVFFLVFGTAPLDVANDSFCRGGYIEKDIQQHYAGWLFYRWDAQGWPLCVTDAVNAPQGLSIAYTDSIPLLAALCRPVAAWWGGTFQYFGWFTWFCLALQGGFAALLCGLFTEGLTRPLLGSLLFITSPILWERLFRHTSLGAQWMLLAALYWYFFLRRQRRCHGLGLFLLNVLAIGIHPYFLPMTYSITLALSAEYALKTKHWKKPLFLLGINLTATGLLGWALGFWDGNATSGGQALYGYFSMNLNALWNPAGVGGVLFSRVLPAQNQISGNYDAFAYLGLGVLLALPVTIFSFRRHLTRILRGHWCLFTVCLVLTAFAISHVVTVNGTILFTFPLPERLIQLCSVFRSGGRLFWPVYDLLVLFAFIGLCRLPRPLLATALLAAIQIWDVSPALIQRGTAMAVAQQSAAFPSTLQSDFWQETAGRYTHLESVQGIQSDALHLALYAADNGMTTDDPFAARYDAAALETQRQTLLSELADGMLRQDSLYLFAEEGAFLQAVEPVKDSAWCGHIRSEDGQSNWYVIAPGLEEAEFDELCTVYDENYPLRLADYTDALWNRGVLDSTKQTVCFADSPFTRGKLENATKLCTDDQEYEILEMDDSDPGWLMITLQIEDATVLWDQELTTR